MSQQTESKTAVYRWQELLTAGAWWDPISCSSSGTPWWEDKNSSDISQQFCFCQFWVIVLYLNSWILSYTWHFICILLTEGKLRYLNIFAQQRVSCYRSEIVKWHTNLRVAEDNPALWSHHLRVNRCCIEGAFKGEITAQVSIIVTSPEMACVSGASFS